MKFSRNTRNYAYSVISDNAKYDSLSECYLLDSDDLSDVELSKLASLIYMDNPDFASESTGADNDSYDRYMIPALLVYLKNTSDKDARIEFDHAWVKGTTQYAMKAIRDLLEEELCEFNHSYHEVA